MLPVAERISKHELPAPAFWAAWAFAGGIFVASHTTNNLFFWFVAAALSASLGIFFHVRSKKALANFNFLILLVGLGALRYSSATELTAGRSVANFVGLNRRMFISGRICELPENKFNRSRIYLDKVAVSWKPKVELEGKILLSIGQPVLSFSLGDRIQLVGFLDSLWPPANPGSLDFARYMRILGVEGAVFLKDGKNVSIAAKASGSLRSRLAKARTWVERQLTFGLPPKAAGVIKGFVLGDTRDIEPSTYELFKKTGTLHLLAVSGANVAWVALLPILLLKLFYLSLRWRYLAALVLVWVFVLFTDLQSSVLRAAIMFTFWTASKVIFREISGLQSWGLCGLFLLIVNPLWFFDIGFELSFLAVFALIVSFAGREEYEKNWFKRWLTQPFWQNFSSSVAVFLLITPLLAYYFNQVAWASLLVNVAAIPLTALITWNALANFALGFLDFSHSLVFVQTKLLDGLFLVQHFFINLPHIFVRVPHPSEVECFLLTLSGFGLLLVFFEDRFRKIGLYLFFISGIPIVWGWGFKRVPEFILSILEARGETVSVLHLPDKTVVIGGGQVGQRQHTPRYVLEPFLAYSGIERIEAYLPLRFDSSGRKASEEIVKKFDPALVGWSVVKGGKKETAASPALNFEYLFVSGDSIPFGLRLGVAGFSFLFLPQWVRSRPPPSYSLFSDSTILVVPLDFARAESLSHHPNIKSIVSIQRLYRRPETLPKNLFFPFRDGMVAFKKEKNGLVATTHLSRRTFPRPVF